MPFCSVPLFYTEFSTFPHLTPPPVLNTPLDVCLCIVGCNVNLSSFAGVHWMADASWIGWQKTNLLFYVSELNAHTHTAKRTHTHTNTHSPYGPMDKAPAYEAGDSGFLTTTTIMVGTSFFVLSVDAPSFSKKATRSTSRVHVYYARCDIQEKKQNGFIPPSTLFYKTISKATVNFRTAIQYSVQV